MTLRLSTALRNIVLDGGSVKDALQGGKLLIYSGAQPATADAAPTGTLLATITTNSGAHTAEVQATGTVTLATGAAGSVNTVTVNGVNVIDAAVPFNVSLAQTATDLAAAINLNRSSPNYTASASGAVVTIKAMRGAGAGANGFVVTGTLTTMTATYANLSAGVTPVNGLSFGAAAAGVLPKHLVETWSGIAAATGTAGWFRHQSSIADSGLVDSTESQVRLDGAISTSGSQLNMSSTTITATATQTITAYPVTLPTA